VSCEDGSISLPKVGLTSLPRTTGHPGPATSQSSAMTPKTPPSSLVDATTETTTRVGSALVLVPTTSAPPVVRKTPGESPVLFGLLSPASASVGSTSPDHIVEKLRQWTQWVHGAYSAHTEVAWESDWRGWLDFCALRGADPLPASPLTVRAYIETRASLGRRKSTIARNVATLAAAHAAAGLPNPGDHPAVHLALKMVGRAQPGSPRQARGLVWSEIAQFLEIADDAMARREELVAVDCEDLTWCADGSARLLIRRSKTDPEGEGSVLYLAAETARYVRTWLAVSGIRTGAVFRRIIGRARIAERLGADSVTDVLKRVGATQDLLALNEGLPAIMQTGRWKDARMVQHYGRHLLAGRSAMARAAPWPARRRLRGEPLMRRPVRETSAMSRSRSVTRPRSGDQFLALPAHAYARATPSARSLERGSHGKLTLLSAIQSRTRSLSPSH
jgi:hypothetical protein